MFSMFQIDLENYFEVKYILLKQINIQPSEIELLPYYEYELLIENHQKYMEKEREAREEEEKGQKGQTYNTDKYMKDAKKMVQQPKMPNMPSGMSMPKLPKF